MSEPEYYADSCASVIPEGWDAPSEAFYKFFTAAPGLIISPLVDPNMAFRLLSWGIGVFAVVNLWLYLWHLITEMREPYWFRKAAQYKTKNPIVSFFTGTALGPILSGHLARRFGLSDSFPGIIRFHNGILAGWLRDVVLVKDPVLCKEILEETNTKKPPKGYRFARRLDGYWAGDDFLTTRCHRDPIYRRTRGLAYKVLMKRTVTRYEDLYTTVVDAFVDTLASPEEGPPRDAVRDMHHIATQLLTKIAFDVQDDSIGFDLFECTAWMVSDLSQRPIHNALKFLDYIPTPRNYQLWTRQARIRSVLLTIVRQKMRALEKSVDKCDNEKDGCSLEEPDDVVSACIKELSTDMRPEEIEKVTAGLIRVLFFAGFDTAGNTMAVVLHHLASDADVQQRAREEVISVLGESGPFSVEKLFRCKYLLAVIKECLRLYPPVPMIAREIQETHPATGLCPRFNSEDTFGAIINIYGLHYNAKGWTRPTEFLPERWLDPGIDTGADPRERVYCPFALGKRSCFGRQFAYIEMLTVVSSILRKYALRHARDSNMDVFEAGTLLLRNLKVHFVPLEDIKENVVDELLPSYTEAEVHKHQTADDLWMIIDDYVYDFSAFGAGKGGGHPGGREVLLAWAGCDATAEFDFIAHSPVARRMLDQYRVGRLVPLRGVDEYRYQRQGTSTAQTDFVPGSPSSPSSPDLVGNGIGDIHNASTRYTMVAEVEKNMNNSGRASRRRHTHSTDYSNEWGIAMQEHIRKKFLHLPF